MFATDQEVMEMLAYMRPHESKSEREFINRFLIPLKVKVCPAGNYLKRIGDAPILWSVHTDTVHRAEGRQSLAVRKGIITLAPKDPANCLGADDTAGLWLAIQMIRAEVPGLYVFHRAEEWGGKGSLALAKSHPAMLGGMRCAIALDRKGYSDIITHQGSRCCSNKFAKSLAKILGGAFTPDDSGIFTDTANYTDLIGECTNISVGYFDQHTAKECLDFDFLRRLRDTMCKADFSGLKFKREAGEADPDDHWLPGKSYSYSYDRKGRSEKAPTLSDWVLPGDGDGTEEEWGGTAELEKMIALVIEHPEAAADLLMAVGYTADEFLTELHRDR